MISWNKVGIDFGQFMKIFTQKKAEIVLQLSLTVQLGIFLGGPNPGGVFRRLLKDA